MEPNPSLDGDGGEPAAPPRESTNNLRLKTLSDTNYLSKFSNFSNLKFHRRRPSLGESLSPYIGEGRGGGGGLNGPKK